MRYGSEVGIRGGIILTKKISVLYINAMGPSENFPGGGVFVTQRIRALREIQLVDVIPVSLFINYSKITRLILQLRAGAVDPGKAISQQMDISYDMFGAKYSFIELFFASYITPRAYFLKSKKILKKIVKKYEGIQLMHMHWIWPCGIALPDVSQEYSIPYVVTCHGSDINVSMRNNKVRKDIIRILEAASCVEFVSQALLNTAMDLGYSGKNAKVVNNGIDVGNFYGKRIPHDINTVGFVGNLIPVKGADRLPAIFQAVYQMMEGQVRFVIVGDGALRKQLEDEMAGLPVTFYGFVSPDQLTDLYAEMDTLLLPSRNEGYTCVIKEAQASGVIPVAADVGGVAEAVGEYGTTISECGSEELLISRLAEAVVHYLSGKRTIDINDMINDAMECSWQNQQRKSIDTYLHLMGNGGKRIER